VALQPVDRVAVTTVVDNYTDALRKDERIARRWNAFVARRLPELRAEHGLCHHVEVTRQGATTRLLFDFGPTPEAMVHNLRELQLDPRGVDLIALSHGHWDHFGGMLTFLKTHRRQMRRDLVLYAGHDHFLPRWNQRGDDRVYTGRLDRDAVERWDVEVRQPREPTEIVDGLLLSGEVRQAEAFEPIPQNLKVERDGAVVQDDFLGEQSLIMHLRDRGLVVITSCSHRGIVGICRHATRIAGVPKVHAVIGGFHLSGLGEERVTAVVDAFRSLGVEYLVPQHCTGFEAMALMLHRMPGQTVVTAVGSTFVFE
jgi:7,8-dihydropterin-6-yl-methyl-4-(beta-D-ribofuranosyl)aminobenzene 5'-phosphate synthase